MIYDKKVWNGGASDERVEELWERQEEGKRVKMEKKNGSGAVSRRGSQRGSVYNRQSQAYAANGSQRDGRTDTRSQMSEGWGRRRTVVDEMNGRY